MSGEVYKPRYAHDCDGCRFLRPSYLGDWYYCERCDEGTILCRYSNEGSNYWSCPLGHLWYADEETRQDGTKGPKTFRSQGRYSDSARMISEEFQLRDRSAKQP